MFVCLFVRFVNLIVDRCYMFNILTIFFPFWIYSLIFLWLVPKCVTFINSFSSFCRSVIGSFFGQNMMIASSINGRSHYLHNRTAQSFEPLPTFENCCVRETWHRLIKIEQGCPAAVLTNSAPPISHTISNYSSSQSLLLLKLLWVSERWSHVGQSRSSGSYQRR